ncbi:MAG: SRPBCC family protein [Flavobacteriaceae bacterium]
MKILKYVLLLLLAVVVGLGIYTAVQPSEYDFARSRTIDAPAQVLYENVDDYKKRALWDPWVERDPSINITYGEKVKGPGASYSWTSDEGDGTITRTESVPHESLSDELDFGSMGKATAYWKFEPEGGGTKVSWGMKAQNVPFAMKFFSAISGGYEGMMGPVFDRGLVRLDSIAQIVVKE